MKQEDFAALQIGSLVICTSDCRVYELAFRTIDGGPRFRLRNKRSGAEFSVVLSHADVELWSQQAETEATRPKTVPAPAPGPLAEISSVDLLATAARFEAEGSRWLARAADLKELAAKLEADRDR